METIPLITSDDRLYATVQHMAALDPDHAVEIVQLARLDEAIDYLNIELPELVFLDFSAEQVAFSLLETIVSDPWLIHGGLVVLCSPPATAQRLEAMHGANIVAVLTTDEVERQLPRVLRIIHNNRRILFQREIGTDLVADITGTFKLANDPIEARCYCNLLCNFLYNSNRIDLATRDMLNLALYEMLMNAIEHGNCGITYEEKAAWLERDGAIVDLIAARCRDPQTARRRVTVEYAIESDCTTFLIADEGDGFNWRAVKDATDEENMLKQHGRGILMASSLARNLEYNEKGNEVGFAFPHPTDVEALTPGLLEHIPPRRVVAGEVIFRQGEKGNDLYYIAKGHYEVLVNDQVVSTMSPEDIFMGEMAFLLDNQRSATVRARTQGTLVGISKKDFIEAIKKKPHYALFLSRLLAQRIQRANFKSARQRSVR